MKQRITSSILLIFCVGLFLWLDRALNSDLPCGFAVGLFLLLGCVEFRQLYHNQRAFHYVLLVSVPLVLLAIKYDFHNPPAGYFTAAIFVFFTAISFLQLINKEVKGAAGNLSYAVFGFVYIVIFGSFLYRIRFLEGGFLLIVFTVATVKISDTGALLAGRMFGMHRLIPWISPNKTLEGFIGGLFAGVIFSLSAHDFLASGYFNTMTAAFFGSAIALTSAFGDLFESMLKRDSGVKDSGSFTPGLGGVLDIIDSLLISAPAAYYILSLSYKTNMLNG